MNKMERKEISTRVLAMSRDEKELVVKHIPLDILQKEIERRNELANSKLDMVYVALAKSQGVTDLQGIIGTINEVRDILAIRSDNYECI